MELNRKHIGCNWLISMRGKMWPGTESNCRHEDFRPAIVPALSVTIRRQVNEFMRLERSRKLKFADSKRFQQMVLAKL